MAERLRQLLHALNAAVAQDEERKAGDELKALVEQVGR
jgi:hypothetical protein